MKYVVVFEQTFEPQMGVTLVEADSPEEAKQKLLDQVPSDMGSMGSTLLVTNVMAADPVAEATPATETTTPLALVTE